MKTRPVEVSADEWLSPNDIEMTFSFSFNGISLSGSYVLYELYVILYWLICHWAVNSIFFAGILVGISWSQPINVWPSFVGFFGDVISES